MTYTMSSGTLNPSIPYHTILPHSLRSSVFLTFAGDHSFILSLRHRLLYITDLIRKSCQPRSCYHRGLLSRTPGVFHIFSGFYITAFRELPASFREETNLFNLANVKMHIAIYHLAVMGLLLTHVCLLTEAYRWRLVVWSCRDETRLHCRKRLQGGRVQLVGRLSQSSPAWLDWRRVQRRSVQHRQHLVIWLYKKICGGMAATISYR